MSISTFIHDLRTAPGYAGQIAHERHVPARAAEYAEPTVALGDAGLRMLRGAGIGRLYTHQAEAFDLVACGADVLVTTGTASGKSLCYLLPLVQALRDDPSATALLLFPTKALCQDQHRALAAMLEHAGLGSVLAGVYDGDTPAPLRRKLRDQARVILTNPDMLHAGLMPQHARWQPFLSHLRLFVVDELHVYNGMFGSNFANLMRRFLRVCLADGAEPRIVACSATVGNPGELAERLFQRPFRLVERDGSPHGARTYLFWNPPVERNRAWRSRRSANVEAHELMVKLMEQGFATIAFSKAKMTAELIRRYVDESLHKQAPELAAKVTAYRGGYLPEERRELERRLFNGELLGVSTTPALELGIDVGNLDASIVVGYPGTLASFLQQAGRAGRKEREALVVLVGLDTPANQFIMEHPDYVFARSVENVVLDAEHPFIVAGHLRCATQELPLREEEVPAFGPHAEMALRVLQDNHKVRRIGQRWYHAASEVPQHELSLRDTAEANVVIEEVDGGNIIGEVNCYDAPPLLHPNAIYMQQDATYLVLTLDMERRIARVKRVETDYYTQPNGGTDVNHVDHCLREKPFGTGRAFWGEVTADFVIESFERIPFYTLDAVSKEPVDLPRQLLETMAVWIVPPEALMERLLRAGMSPHAGLRGIGYATRMVLPLFVTCDTASFSHTIGCVNAPWNAVFIYERHPFGLGFTEKAYELLHVILPSVLDKIRACACEDGCPCCVGKPLRQFTTWNVERGEGAIPSRRAAVAILEGLLATGGLEHEDTLNLESTEAARALRMEQTLRRRLERQREPQVFHPIEPVVPTAYPDAEPESTLDTPDVTRRILRRSAFERELRKRMALPREPAPKPPDPTPVSPPPASPEPPAVRAGDDLAARARRLKRRDPGA